MNNTSNYSDFQRSNDNSYRYISIDNDRKREIFLHYTGEIGAESYETAKSIGEWVNKGGLKDLSTKICQDKQGNLFKITLIQDRKRDRLARTISKFVKLFKNESKIAINIEKIQSAVPNNPSVKTTGLVVCEKDLMIESAAFQDGYTQLAREAFQKFEPEFAAHDNQKEVSKTDHSKFKIIQISGKIQLVPLSAQYGDQRQSFKNYMNFVKKEYGSEKIDYIVNHYKIDINGPLTPEIIYRINIGAANLEKQDIQAFISKISSLTNLDEMGDLELTANFTQQELRGIYRLPQMDPPNLQNLKEWIKNFQRDSLINQQKKVIDILSFTTEEKEYQFTGRKILYPIMSKYTIADKKFYKPWVDQQELLQIFPDLENCQQNGVINWDRYCELLSHVVVKKHLARQHPTEGYRVGALIPAPLDQEGNKRWYVVSNSISNGKGLHSYTFEPLNSESNLPAIKLYRNTAHSHYALDNFATVTNDINPLNSPGYEGFELSRKYEEKFFKERSLALWVGYTLQAEKIINNTTKFEELSPAQRAEQRNLLTAAINAYSREELRPFNKNLHQVLQIRDAELIEIAQHLSNNKMSNFFSLFKFISIVSKYRKSDQINEMQQKDAEFLLQFIDRNNPKYAGLVQDLELCAGKPSKAVKQEIQEKLSLIQSLQNELAEAYSLNTSVSEPSILNVLQKLKKLAADANELPENKINQSVIITGHSLGGAAAQKAYVEYLAKSERMPLKEAEFSLRTFDPPAINREDNQAYHAYGKHQKLFKAFGAKFSITHRMEAGDFVAQSGEEHLGASTDKEETELEKWTTFEVTISESLRHATTAEIRDTPIAHATQFEKGRRHSEQAKHLIEYQDYLKGRIAALKYEKPKTIAASKVIEESWSISQLQARIKEIDALVHHYLGDYQRTWIDAKILKKFDEGDKKNWSAIQTVFKLMNLRSNFVEKTRAFLGLTLRVMLCSFPLNKSAEIHEAGHGEWWRHRDNQGVFALNLEGIQSKKS